MFCSAVPETSYYFRFGDYQLIGLVIIEHADPVSVPGKCPAFWISLETKIKLCFFFLLLTLTVQSHLTLLLAQLRTHGPACVMHQLASVLHCEALGFEHANGSVGHSDVTPGRTEGELALLHLVIPDNELKTINSVVMRKDDEVRSVLPCSPGCSDKSPGICLGL